jgi:hypothetical protein
MALVLPHEPRNTHLGGTLASLGIGEAGADELCKPEGKKCRKDAQCCSGNCEGGKCAAACTSNGGTCSANNQCCSGRCASGMCAEPCPDGRDLLENGTCVKPCTPGAGECTGAGCVCAGLVTGTATYCGTAGSSECSDAIPCRSGEFCAAGGRCFAAC